MIRLNQLIQNLVNAKQISIKSKMSKVIQFTNCQLIKTDGIEYKSDFWINGNKISNELKRADIIIDCKKLYISPGYIDLQLNGGWGYNFSSSSDEDIDIAIKEVSKQLVKKGVVAYCPTVITSSKETYRKILPKIKRNRGGKEDGATILGAHLEGPFISSFRKGAHPIDLIQDQVKINSIEQFKECYGTLDNVSIITMAPELCNNPSIYKELKNEYQITVSLGHTNATLEQAELAIENNCNLITHLYNAMPSFHHREPGIIGCLTSHMMKGRKNGLIEYDSNNNLVSNKQSNGLKSSKKNKDQLYYGVICDNVHTHESALRFAYQANPEGFICVTDGVASMGLESNQKHTIGDLLIEIKGNQAMIAGTNTLCGSIVQLDQCVKNFKKATNCSIYQAVSTATSRPAKAIGIYPEKGSLEPDCDASFLIMTENLDVLATFINGELVWNDSKLLSILPNFDLLL